MFRIEAVNLVSKLRADLHKTFHIRLGRNAYRSAEYPVDAIFIIAGDGLTTADAR